MGRIVRFLFVFFLLMAGGTELSGGGHYNFSNVEQRNGIPSGVSCIFVEDRGYAWVGTPDGLVRYDGHDVRRYTAWEGDENALPDNEVLQVLRDSLGNVWVMTSLGVARYCPESDNFRVPRTDDAREEAIRARSACLVRGGVLFGAQNRIYKYEYSTGRIVLHTNFLSDTPYYFIENIAPWGDNTVLCFNRWLGILSVDLTTGAVSRPIRCQKENFGMLADSRGRVWVFPYNNGIECYDADGDLVAVYNTGNSSLSHNIVLCATEHSDGTIWIGTDGGGINILDPDAGAIEVIRHIPGEKNTLPDNSIKSLHFDARGNLWAGRVKGGLCVIRKVGLRQFSDCPLGETRGLSEKNINCLYQETGSDIVWVGTNGEGVNRFDPATDRFTHYPSTYRFKVTSMTALSSRVLLLSVFSGGLFIFDKETGEASRLSVGNVDFNYQMRYSGKSVNLLGEGGGSVLLLSDSVYRYHRRMDTLEKIRLDGNHRGTTQAVETRGGRAYFHDLQNIYSVLPASSAAEPLHTFGSDTLINSIHLGDDGVFYIASNKGIGAYDPGSRHYTHVRNDLFLSARSVVRDGQGRLWIGTDYALYAYLPDTGRVLLFGESEGVEANEYRPKARILAKTGEVLLGGVNGLVMIDNDFAVGNSEDFEIVLADVELDGERANDLVTDGNIKVSHNSKRLSVRVIPTDGDLFRKKLYRFRTKGSDDDIIQKDEPEIDLRSPAPGSYSLEVTCNTADGRWLPWQKVLDIVVRPPWYRTAGFRAACFAIVLIILVIAFLIIIQIREARLEEAYRQKERQDSEEKIRFLVDICHELRTPLTLVMTPLKKLLDGEIDDCGEDNRYLSLIYKQTRRMKELIDTVLYVRKMEVNGTTIDKEPHEVNAWVAKVIEDFAIEAESRGIALRFEPDPAAGTVCYDDMKCMIVLNNLISNALKHTPDGSEITIRTLRDDVDGILRVSVTDRGSGLGNVDVNHLFTRFYQGLGERSGSGIGLSASKILVEQHGGTIGAESNPDVGSTFFFELPTAATEGHISLPTGNYLSDLISGPDPAGASGSETGVSGKSASVTNPDAAGISASEDDGRVAYDLSTVDLLMVDDDGELLELVSRFLSKKVRSLYTAFDGVEALEIMQKVNVDAVISDVKMQRMDGYALCREIKTRIDISHIPIILLTEFNAESDRMMGYKNGADEYLTKPFDIEMLVTVLSSVMRNRELVRNRYREQTSAPTEPEDVTFSSADEAFLTRLNSIIQSNIDRKELGIPFLCQEIYMSRTVLFNKLKAVTGMNIKDYINKIRMEKAMELVSTTKLSFSEISTMVGFSSSRYFSTSFRQHTGQTPSQYRSTHSAPEMS